MLPADIVHPEGGRYAAALVLVPGLWMAPAAWRAFAGYLGHRGWESHLVDPRSRGGIVTRSEAVAAYAAALPVPPVLIGHDAGVPIALEAARRGPAAAIVALAPLVPRAVSVRALGLGLGSVLAILAGRPVADPAGVPEDAALVREILWGSPPTPTTVPTLVVTGETDPLLPAAVAQRLVHTLGADEERIHSPGRSPLAGRNWQATVGVVHRWLVRQLGEPLLDLYPEAMADRDAED
jgi:pimeloyl-ACP methyl ester carboxylesterase